MSSSATYTFTVDPKVLNFQRIVDENPQANMIIVQAEGCDQTIVLASCAFIEGFHPDQRLTLAGGELCVAWGHVNLPLGYYRVFQYAPSWTLPPGWRGLVIHSDQIAQTHKEFSVAKRVHNRWRVRFSVTARS